MFEFRGPAAGRASGRAVWGIMGVLLVLLAVPAPGNAQESGTIQGMVVAEGTGAPLAGVSVRIPAEGIGTLTDARGRYRLVGLRVGTYQVVAERLGLSSEQATIEVGTAVAVNADFRLSESALLVPEIVVSTTQETRRLSETAASVGVITSEQLQQAKPTHPSGVMSQIPGVWVNVTGGEGHMTAIRQPQTTKPVYLFLEDGVPTRSTGFFNHNALYEVNLPQADRVEVLKGPASALYGSDAIGGVINVETARPSSEPSAEAFAEGGGSGYGRVLLSASGTSGGNGLRAALNLTRTDGWRDGTGYDRQSATLRWDSYLGDRTTLRTVLTGSQIDQQTAGSSALPRERFESDPEVNFTPISYRNVRAARLSTAATYTGDRMLVSVTPFLRWNEMEMIPNWSLTYDPTVYETGHSSVGVLARVRHDIGAIRGRVIAGVDIDHSPGGRREQRIVPTRIESIFTTYELADVIYDYDVTFSGASPYLQAESNPFGDLHLTAGLRYDNMRYRYRSALDALDTGRWRRPADADRTYQHLSPKVGATYDLRRELAVYGNYTHGFRAPSEGQLFRQGSAANTLDLEPVTVDSYELGARGQLGTRFGYTLAAYEMHVSNDILGYTLADGTPETQNAGRTEHRGVEVGLNLLVTRELRFDGAYSLARHRYDEWSPRPDVDYAGKEMESAPRSIVNGRVTYTPEALANARLSLEWNRIGSFWMDPVNSHRYDGHDLFNVSATLPLPHELEVVARVFNLADTRYAETASYTQARGEEFAPGMPRTFYLGFQYQWQQ